PLATKPAILDAAIWHVIDPPARYVANDDAANLQGIPSLLRAIEVAREDAGLQAEAGVVSFAQRVLEARETRQDGDWAEGFGLNQLTIARDILDQCGLEHGPGANAAAQQSGAGRDRVVDPGLEAFGRRFGNHRPDESVLMTGVADG